MRKKKKDPTPGPDQCSICGRENFRKCPCPWDKPFDKWPSALLMRAQSLTQDSRVDP